MGDDYGMGDYGAEEQYGGNSGGASPVLMVYGLNPDKMNCERLFNILCLYGNIVKVRRCFSQRVSAFALKFDTILL